MRHIHPIRLLVTAALVFSCAATSFAKPTQPTTTDLVNKLIAVLKSDAPQKEKADACRELARIGTKDAVAPLAALLADEKLSHMARYGLETIPDAAVDSALREALPKLRGMQLVGVIGSIGVRHDAGAVKALTGLLHDSDNDVAQAAARALGSIGTKAAAKALLGALPNVPATNQLAFCEGLLRCSETAVARGDRKEAMAIYDRLRQIQAHPKHMGTIRPGDSRKGGDEFAKRGAKVNETARPDFDLHEAHRTFIHLLRGATSSALNDEQFARQRELAAKAKPGDDSYAVWMMHANTMPVRFIR